MSDPMQNLNDAADALNQVAARAAGFWDDADAQIAQRQGAYDGLAANLKGVVNNQMYFTAIIDPDEANPTNIDGGTFNSIGAAITAAPSGALVEIQLIADKTYTIDQHAYAHHKFVYMRKIGAGADPILDHLAYADATYNHVYQFQPHGLCFFRFLDIEIRLPTAKADNALPWSSSRTAIAYQVCTPVFVGMLRGRVVGGVAGDNLALMSANGGCAAHLHLWLTTLDGPIFGIAAANIGLGLVAKNGSTLTNGADYIQDATATGHLIT